MRLIGVDADWLRERIGGRRDEDNEEISFGCAGGKHDGYAYGSECICSRCNRNDK